METFEFQPMCWVGRDVSTGTGENGEDIKEYIVDIMGKNHSGDTVCVHVPFFPYFFVEILNPFETPAQFMEDFTKEMKYRCQEEFNRDFVRISTVKRKKFFGFTNDKEVTFVLLVFKTQSFAKRTASGLEKRKNGMKKAYELYESNVDPVLRLMHMQDLESTGWIAVSSGMKHVERKETCCDIEVRVPHKYLRRVTDKESIAPLVIASFDIEAYSGDGTFPNPSDPNCPCIQIATTFQRYGDKEPYLRTIVCFKETDPVDGAECYWYPNEKDMLLSWVQLLRREKADVLTGFNTWGFDMDYIWRRVEHVCDPLSAHKFKVSTGRYLREPAQFRQTKLSSSAYGNNSYDYFATPGIFQLDLLPVIKKEFKLDSYKLDSVSEHFLGDHKIDLTPNEMFELFRGNAADRQKIAEYCIKDTELPLRLIQKLGIIPNMVQMASACHVPVDFLTTRGQQIRCFSQILKLAREEGYLVPTRSPMKANDEGYEGATVLDPEVGAYLKEKVVVLDFSSLYPSIMRAHNLCHSTIVLDKKYDNLQGVEYYEYGGWKFVQNRQGLLPKLLENLAKYRKAAKKKMEEAAERGDAFAEMLYNGKQLAYKVSMNSAYGFCGASNGFLPCLPIASTVTGTGRKMIERTKELIEAKYSFAKVRYGDTDSVFIDVGQLDMEEAFRFGQDAAAHVTDHFNRPISIEFEKVFSPFLLLSKKRYVGLKYTSLTKPPKLDMKGVQLVRRDTCPFVKRVCKEALNKIMYQQDLQAAIQVVRDATRELLEGRAPIEELTLSKTLAASSEDLIMDVQGVCTGCGGKTMMKVKDELVCQNKRCGLVRKAKYKNLTQAHITVACKLEERNPGSGPKSNDRVPFVYIQGPKALNASEKVDDPKHVKEKGVPIDYYYYLNNGLVNPTSQLFEELLPKGSDLFDTLFDRKYIEDYQKKNEKQWKAMDRVHKNQQKGLLEITSFFKPKQLPPELLDGSSSSESA